MPENKSTFWWRGSVVGICVVAALAAASGLSQPPAQTQQEQRFDKAAAKVMSEGIDLFVDRFVDKKDRLTESDWKVLNAIIDRLDKKAKSLGHTVARRPDYSMLPVLAADAVEHKDLFPMSKRAVAKRVAALTISEDLVVCSGPVAAQPGAMGKSVIIANDTVVVAGSIMDSVVVCAADVQVIDGSIGGSIIIANGDIKCNVISESVVYSNGSLDVSAFVRKSKLNVKGYVDITGYLESSSVWTQSVVSAGTIKKGNVLQERLVAVTSIINFFQPLSIGIEAHALGGKVAVKRIVAGGPSSRAGLKAGDVIVSVDGQNVYSIEQFRRLLRRSAAKGAALLSINGSNKLTDIRLPITD